ncbi:receptor-type tyrosine-protein phosphatase kappa-like [Gigantopelta aegis]|uniref:receptor-type tyrosine-protein phosphatase kappa-like n=1 Tax=Gigantopelta aegis TaxID=1735272 RepID=UPI001B88E134|nr:receptor-type tyrosine-protein phosphatase kappa-like [Gigantopelta aegis]
MAKILISGILLVCVFIAAVLTESTCPLNKYGWRCRFKCRCRNGTCDPQTGSCKSGCRSPRYGTSCQLKNQCLYDLHGVNYTGTWNKAKGNKVCIPWSDEFVQKKGYTPDMFPDKKFPENYCRNPREKNGKYSNMPWCYIARGGDKPFASCTALKAATKSVCQCPDYMFGVNCAQQCHCRNESEVCDKRYGNCGSGCAPGWSDFSCQTACPVGKYGLGCSKTCEFCLDDRCDPETGHCVQGCQAGHRGDFCDTPCALGTFGPNCQEECGNCRDGEPCRPTLGDCFRGCAPGYTNTHCKEKCPPGRYGLNCDNLCGQCHPGTDCSHITGFCTSGCDQGYKGDKCDTECQEGTYGENCTAVCGHCKGGTPCLTTNGQCLKECDEGYFGYRCVEKIEMSTMASETGGIIGGVLAFILVFLIIFLLVIFIRRRRHKNTMSMTRHYVTEEPVGHPTEHNESIQLLGDSRIENSTVLTSETEDNTINEEVNEPIYVNINSKKQTNPIPLSDLYDVILKYRENSMAGFKTEFDELPMGLLALCEVARRPDNKAKNRYGNIVAYDHSRVTLEPISNEPFSDYVNANFMDGYSKKKSYIASQGPNKAMIRDFWRMVWQQRVSKIVMLTNLVEACKKKCEQYWPSEGSIKYGEVTVRNVNEAKYTDYIIRTFEISKDSVSRIVKQFHFTTWSDHGAPTFPTTLLAFRRKIHTYSPDSTAPVLSHCSAGIGRTGTFIALDYLLEQAANENQIDVLGIAQLMRTNRVNMIQTWEQYAFVYEAVLESIKSGETTIPKSAFRNVYQNMSQTNKEGETTPLEKQYEVLQLLSPNIDRDECTAACAPENNGKNRFQNILPANRCRPFLYTPVQGCTDYINAVFLPGYTQKDRFIVTQMPLPGTVADFWRMLYDYTSDTVVMLNEFDRNDKSCALYWPEEYGYTEEYGPLSVELLSSSEADVDVTIRVFKLSHTIKGEERAVKQFQFKSWPDYQTIPNSVTALLRLQKLVSDWLKQNGKGPISIHCMNGASKSGLFAAISLVLERLTMDQEVDIYQTIKQIRMNRPQFIENFEQYQFCYQLILEYLDSQDHS